MVVVIRKKHWSSRHWRKLSGRRRNVRSEWQGRSTRG